MKNKHSSLHSILSSFLAVSLGLSVAGMSPLGSQSAQAANATNNYTGTTTGNITTPGNWSLGHVPTVTEDAVFPSTAATGIRNYGGGATPGATNVTFGSLDDLSTGTTISLRNDTSSASAVTLTLGGAGNLGNGVSGANASDLIYVVSGGTLNITGVNGSNTLGLVLGQSGNFDIAGTGASTISSIISDGGSGFGLTKTGAGTLTLSVANSYSGGTTISGDGTLIVSNTGALGGGAVTMNGGALRAATAGGNITNDIIIGSGANILSESGTNNFSFTGALSGAGNVTFGGGGGNASIKLQFSANTMTSGTITLQPGNTGIARINNTASSNAAVDWVINGGSSEVSGTFNFGSFGGAGNFSAYNGNSGAIIYSVGGNNNDATYSGVLSSTGTNSSLSLIKIGTGAWTLSGANSFVTAGSGAASTTTVQNGSLIAGTNAASNANGAFGKSTTAIALGDATTISSGTAMNPKLLTGGAFTIGRDITVGASNGALGNAGTTFTIGGNTANTSTFSGVTTLNQNLAVTQVTGGTLNLTGNITSGSGGTQTITFNNAGSVSQSTGVIGGGTGTIAVNQTGTGTTTLSGANTYTGATTVNGGTLKAGVASVANTNGAFGNNSAVTLANSAGVTLDITGFNTQIGSLAGGGATGGNVTLGAATLTTGGNNTSPAAYAGAISGTGALSKIGSGTQILSGSNTYSGTTTISNGTWKVNGLHSGAGAYTVQSGATLGGSGTITTAVGGAGISFASGAKLSPGNSPGTLTVNLDTGVFDISNTVTGSSMNLEFDLASLASYDRVLLTGNGTNALEIGIGVLGFNDFAFNTSGWDMATGVYTLFDTNKAISGSLSSVPGALTGTLAGLNATISFGDSGRDIILTVTAVPEPAAYGVLAGLLLSGLSMTSIIRRRRHSTACGPR